jgi:hypothetical protein
MVTISAQFNGPDTSGNGGYVSGLLAQAHGAEQPVTATLRVPPPLETPLTWEPSTDLTRLVTHGGSVVGEATDGGFARDVPACPTPEQREAGLVAYPGFHHHPFDRCFTCGTAREDGDGLRLFTGPVGDGLVAGTFHAHEAFAEADGTLGLPVAWAALDCSGGWAADFSEHVMVLGRMTAHVEQPLVAGRTYASVGRLAERSGRKFLTDTALYAEDGTLVGRAEQVWIEVDPARFA